MDMIARFRKVNCTWSSLGKIFCSSQYSPFIFGIVVFVIRDMAKGTKSTRSTLSINRPVSIVAMVPAKISRYNGSNTSCRIRFIGRMDAESDTFPRAMPVKSKYQSVHGVTISIINPIHRAGTSLKNRKPRTNASRGLNMKLMLALTLANLQFLKDLFS
jgi:hypothetical protein